MVTKMFKDQIGDIVEVYIDDMVVKSTKSEEHVLNLVKNFEILRQHKLRLNAGECAFGFGGGGSSKFLGLHDNKLRYRRWNIEMGVLH